MLKDCQNMTNDDYDDTESDDDEFENENDDNILLN